MAQWFGQFPKEPGWYWCYQELAKGAGTYISPIWVETGMHLPRNIVAYYGPVTPPDVPDEFISDVYKKKKDSV